MSDAQRPKNDGDAAEEQVDATAPLSDDAPAADQASSGSDDTGLTRGGPVPDTAVFSAEGADGYDDGSADAASGSDGAGTAAAGVAGAGTAAGSASADAGSAGGVAAHSTDVGSASADADAGSAAGSARAGDSASAGSTGSAAGSAGAGAAGTAAATGAAAGSATPVSADKRGDEMADVGSGSEEPDYEALAAELDRLEASGAAPGAREPESTDKAADPWFEPSKSDTFTATEPAQDPHAQPALDEPNATPNATPTAAASSAHAPIFVQAPEPPRKRGNRGAAGLIGLVAAVAFAVLYAAANYLWQLYLSWASNGAVLDPIGFTTEVLLQPPFWFTVVAFWLSFWLLGVFVNRARWWSWVVLGLIVALLTYIGEIAGHFLDAPFWNLTGDEGMTLLGNSLFAPTALMALILAREVTIWFGAWVSRRGARVAKLNAEERDEYDRVMADGPTAP